MKKTRASLVWRLTPIIVALRKLKQEVIESLSSAQPWLHSSLHLKTNKELGMVLRKQRQADSCLWIFFFVGVGWAGFETVFLCLALELVLALSL